jgi:RNA polymerase sigma factor (sigma-70 family)
MKKSVTSTREVLPSLQQRYPVLTELLEDLDGFQKFILAKLRSFGLERHYKPDDILNECFLRWYKAVENGKSIPSLAGWMRVTAFNVISELSRETKKANPYDPSILENLLPDAFDEVDGQGEDNQQQAVRKALNALSDDKRELLELRFFHNLSWDGVAAHFMARGEKVTVSTLRKRGQRAIEELRKVFLRMLEN